MTTPSAPSWQPAAALAARELARLDSITAETVARIRDELPDFVLVPLAEHTQAVRQQLQLRLVAFKDRRAWSEADLEQAVTLARRRARQGVSVESLISAFHVGDRQLWKHLSHEPGHAAPLLAELASLMLESMQAVSTTLASTHSRESRAHDRLRIGASQRFIEGLLDGEKGPEISRLAAFLGITDETAMTAAASRTDGTAATWYDAPPSTRVAPESGAISARIGEVLTVLSESDQVMQNFLKDTATSGGLTGVGHRRKGLDGARASLQQALLAAQLATHRQPTVIFGESWHLLGTSTVAHLVEPDVRQAIDVAVAHPTLRTTVLAFADADLSKPRCAALCHVHPNTVAYRLDRWALLTGWDPRTFEGLLQSVLACTMSETQRGLTGEPTDRP